MQALLSSFFVTNQVYIIIFVLVISSIFFLNYLIANFKVELNLKKFHYNSDVLKINTSDWCTNDIIQRIKERIIKRLIDKKIINKNDEAKVIAILARTGNNKKKEEIVSANIPSSPMIIIPKQLGTFTQGTSTQGISTQGTGSSTEGTSTQGSSTPETSKPEISKPETSTGKSSVIIPTKA